MPPMADFVAIQDGATTLSQDNVVDINDLPGFSVNFDTPDVHLESRPVLMLRVNPQVGAGGSVTLTASINGTQVIYQTFDTDMHRSWHEIVDASVLKEFDNDLAFVSWGADIIVSDIVMLYRRRT